MRHLIAFLTAAGSSAWLLALIGAPLGAGDWPGLAGLVYAVGALVCHQQPERSFHLGDAQLPVCARCLGLYAGAAAGTLAWSLWRAAGRPGGPHLPVAGSRLVLIAAVPTAASVAAALVDLGDLPNLWRAAFAVPLGIAGGAVVGAAATRDLR
jgi:uncharacterized membrane protein